MHLKTRNGRAMLYRSRYVRKGAENNTHGYPKQKFVGSLLCESQAIPDELAAKLSPEETAYVENKVIFPARRAAQDARSAEDAARSAKEARERDPRWRIEDALRLLAEAERLVSVTSARIDPTRVKSLYKLLDALAGAAKVQSDPLDSVLAAVASATAAVKGGHYGTAPADNVRDTAVYKRWQKLRDIVDSGNDSLLKALQAKRWVRVRG